MSAMPAWTFFAALILAAALEVCGNLLLTKSDGFRKVSRGLRALALVGLAFTFLAYAVKGMDLSVAYALWGGIGIVGTSIGGAFLFGHRLKKTAWIGMAMLIGGMLVLHFV